MNVECKIFYARDLDQEEVALNLEVIKEKNRRLHDFITENIRKDSNVGIREDVLNYLCEHIGDFRTDQEYTYGITSLICNTTVSAEYLEWVNAYFEADARIQFNDFMVVLGEAIDKQIPLRVIKEMFADAEDELAIYSKVIEYVAPAPVSDAENTSMPVAESNIPGTVVDSEPPMEVSAPRGLEIPDMFNNLLTVVRLRDSKENSVLEWQEELNKITAEFQMSLSKLSSFSTEMVREWEKDKEEIQRLTAFNEILQKFLANNQSKTNEMRNEIKMLRQKLQEMERSELQQQTISEKVAELNALTSKLPYSDRSVSASFREN